MRSKKLKWNRLGNGFDIVCLNPDRLDQKAARKLLRKIEVIYDDFKKPFDKDASKLWQEWIENPRQPLDDGKCLRFYLTTENDFKSFKGFIAGELGDIKFLSNGDFEESEPVS